MSAQKSVSQYKSVLLDHAQRRQAKEQEQRQERAAMIGRHKAEYETLKTRQQVAMFELRSRLLCEERELRRGGKEEEEGVIRQVCKRSMACLTNGLLKPNRIDPIALNPIPEKRRREEDPFVPKRARFEENRNQENYHPKQQSKQHKKQQHPQQQQHKKQQPPQQLKQQLKQQQKMQHQQEQQQQQDQLPQLQQQQQQLESEPIPNQQKQHEQHIGDLFIPPQQPQQQQQPTLDDLFIPPQQQSQQQYPAQPQQLDLIDQFLLSNEDFQQLSDDDLELLEFKPARLEYGNDADSDEVNNEDDEDDCQIIYEQEGDPFDYSKVQVKLEPAEE